VRCGEGCSCVRVVQKGVTRMVTLGPEGG
jgi:hypothetical protein